jgi:hypothetical protein
MDCVAACPVPGALEMRLAGRWRISPLRMAGAVVGIFLVAVLGARAAGAWENAIGDREYVQRIQEIDSPAYGHPGR